MVPMSSLWLPTLAAAVAVFVVSSLVHMVLKWHSSDYRELPNEPEALDALRRGKLAPGMYTFPHCKDMKEMGSPAMQAKYLEGPIGHVTIMPNRLPAMGKYLGLWFLYILAVSAVVACLTGTTLAPGAPYKHVFHATAVAAALAYFLPPFVDSIWKGQTWGSTLKHVADGLLYTLATAAVFAWLWPR
jgi:hypothetical protein